MQSSAMWVVSPLFIYVFRAYIEQQPDIFFLDIDFDSQHPSIHLDGVLFISGTNSVRQQIASIFNSLSILFADKEESNNQGYYQYQGAQKAGFLQLLMVHHCNPE